MIHWVNTSAVARRSAAFATGMVLVALCYGTFFEQPSKFVEVVDLSSYPAGPWQWLERIFPYHHDGRVVLSVVDPGPQAAKFLRTRCRSDAIYTGFGIGIYSPDSFSVPPDASLAFSWRSTGDVPFIQVDVSDGRFEPGGTSKLESFSEIISTPPSEAWSEVAVCLDRFEWASSQESMDAYHDGNLDSSAIAQVAFTLPPGTNATLDIRDIRFIWGPKRATILSILAFAGLLGLSLLLLPTAKDSSDGDDDTLLAPTASSYLLYSLSVASLVLSFLLFEDTFHNTPAVTVFYSYLVLGFIDAFKRPNRLGFRLYRLRYAAVLLTGCALGTTLNVVAIFLLLLAGYIPSIRCRDRALSSVIAALSLLVLSLGPYLRVGAISLPHIVTALLAGTAAALFSEMLRHRRTRSESRRTTDLYEGLLANATDAIYTLDAGRIIQTANRGFEITVGLPTEQVIGRSVLEFIHDEDHDLARNGTNNDRQEDCRECELRFIGKQGAIRTLLVNERTIEQHGRLVGYQAIARDITNRRQRAEEVLQESREQFRTVVEASKDGMIAFNREGHITIFNPAASEMFGYGQEEIISQPIHRLIPDMYGEERDHYVKDLFAPHASSDTTGRTVEIPALRSDGVMFPIELSLSVGECGEQSFILAVVRDITARKQAEKEKEELQEQLRQAQKMEAIGQLAGGVAHDFNNLLQVISGYTELAMSGLDSKGQRYQELEQVCLAAKQAATLTRQLLTFSRRQIIQPLNIDLNVTICNLMKMLHRLLGEHIDLELNLSQGECLINADPGIIEQVILNLCVNARDAITESGRITIETQHALPDKMKFEGKSLDPSLRYVLLSISDNGRGIPPEVQERIFEPFFTTKEQGKGTGLGLATVYGAIKQHQGTITVVSELDKGSSFNILLPLAEREAISDTESPAHRPSIGNETILLAEDEEPIRAYASRILQESGYTVLSAVDGIEAIRLFERNADTVDLVFLDVVMPGLSGPAVYDRVKQIRPDVLALFCTGYSRDVTQRISLSDAAQPLLKPYSSRDLLERVRRILDGHKADPVQAVGQMV